MTIDLAIVVWTPTAEHMPWRQIMSVARIV